MASKYKGYMGKYAIVNLSTGAITEDDVSDRDRELFLGGKGLATKMLMDIQKPGVDPYSPEAHLIINTGPLTAANAPCSSRFNVTCKSPATGGIATANCGGNFGMQLKKAGFDAIVITGKSDHPVFIDITDNHIEIRDATDMWGMDTEEAQEHLGPKGGKAVIGPAGENLVIYAGIVSNERIAGRCGVGAVMGSKKLKALRAIGTQKVPVAEPEKFKTIVKSWIDTLKAHPSTGELMPRYGTANMVNKINLGNAFPTKNFQHGFYEHADKISGETLADTLLVKNSGCTTCPIRCARVVNVEGKDVKGPEFETLGLLGSNIANSDLYLICKWNREMDLLGIDTISCGSTIAFAMELNEKGILKSELEFGRTDNISKILDDIAHRRGVGDILADGVKKMAAKYGGEEFAIHAKGLEIASYDPRGAHGLGLGYATANRGGCHLNAGYLMYLERLAPINMDPLSPKSKEAWNVMQQDLLDAISACGSCLFTSFLMIPKVVHGIKPYGTVSKIVTKTLGVSGPAINLTMNLPDAMTNFHIDEILPHSRAVEALTGIPMSFGKFTKVGARVFNLERLFNLREGLTCANDTLPKRLTHTRNIPDNPKSVVPLDRMLPRYYRSRGWTKTGVPTKKKLRKLGMENIAPGIPE